MITDEESILKRQARRRLLGAIALTILAVTLLPMLLDSEPPKPGQDIDLQIPDKDKVGEFVPKMVLPPLNAADASSQPVTAPVTPVIVPLLDTKPVATVPSPKSETKPLVKSIPQSAQEQKSLETEITRKPELKSETKPVAKMSPKQVSKPHSGFVIQVGAFTTIDAAKKLQDKLHVQGYSSYTEKAGHNIRVRVGDYTTHTEADKIRQKLEIQGYKPNVINLN